MESYPQPGYEWEEDHGVYCPICGCSFEDDETTGSRRRPNMKETSPAPVWTTKSVLLDDPQYPDEELDGLGFIRKYKDAPIRVRQTSGSGINGFPLENETDSARVYPFQDPGSTDYPVLFIPMHSACFDVVEHFLAYQTSIHPVSTDLDPREFPPRTLRDLFNVLRLRLEGGGSGWDTWGIHSPKHYYIEDQGLGSGTPLFTQEYWQFKGQYYDADPSAFPDSVKTMLRSFDPVQHTTKLKLDFQQRIQRLPTELLDKIYELVIHDLEDMPKECTYLLPQKSWRDILLDKHSVPWLWDADKLPSEESAIESEGDSSDVSAARDWELLVRTLTRSVDFKPNTPSELPAELRNRRRIWRLLCEMRLGDYRGKSNGSITRALSIDWSEDEDEDEDDNEEEGQEEN